MTKETVEWYGEFEARHISGFGSTVARKSTHSHYWDTSCVCFDSEFGTPEETAEMIAALLNKWLRAVNKINDGMSRRAEC